jgi:hypothetical protein
MEPRDVSEAMQAAPFLGYVMQVEVASTRVYDDFSRCTCGFEEWIKEACRNPCDDTIYLPPRYVSDISQHTYIGLELEGILERLRLARQEVPRTEAGDEREETCESPIKKARMSPEASPSAPTWAGEGVGSGRAPVASPCRNAARLGPVPKDPPPRNLFQKEHVEEEPPRELSSPKKRLRDRPTPPSQTMATSLFEGSMTFGASGERTWQHKALFNPPPAATAKAKVAAPAGKTGLFSQPITSTSSSSPAQRTRNINQSAPAVGSAVVSQNEGSESVADMVKRIEGSAPTTQDTPVSVFDRIRIFEGTKSTPSLRQPGSTSAVVPSPAVGGGRPGSNGTSAAVANASAPSTSGSSLMAPVKPKELFRNTSESTFRYAGSATVPASTLTKSASSTSVDSRRLAKDASSQKLAPHSFDVGTSSAPASLFSVGPTSSSTATRSGAEGNSKASNAPSSTAPKKKAHRRSAVCCAGDLEGATFEVVPSSTETKSGAEAQESMEVATVTPIVVSSSTEGNGELTGAAATQPSTGSASTSTQQRVRPAVPLFSEEPPPTPQRLEPCMVLRLMSISDKLPEDNYEISEHGGDSDAEDCQARDRSGKHVPKWCENYLDALSRQTDIDPDTIFGPRVPRCVLDDIFTDAMYKQANKNRPKRARGSSGDWRKDQLARKEISDYKSRMGHARSWRDEGANDVA